MSEASNKYSCAVLLATYNGENWISEQLDSISAQCDVDVKLFVSDDQSTDNTLEIIKYFSNRINLEILSDAKSKFGSANKNFLRLIRDVNIESFDFIAFCDQDDVWSFDKLICAIKLLNSENADAYSSNVTAFWNDGSTKDIIKSSRQKEWDHFFGSPGPGCSFVFRNDFFTDLKKWIVLNYDDASRAWVHDWLLYVYARQNNYKWIIDSKFSLMYRQHYSNEIGANSGLIAFRNRFRRVRDGRYRSEILFLCDLFELNAEWVLRLRRMKFLDRIWLIFKSNKYRRSNYEVAMLMVLFLFMN